MLVMKAIVVSVTALSLLLSFILLRRAYRKHYFTRHDAKAFAFRQQWDAILSGQVAYEAWRQKAFDRGIVQTMALDDLEAAGPEESARLLRFLRASGLIEKLTFEARTHTGWRRMRALVALGRTRAAEGIPALAQGLRDTDIETRLAALRGLGRTASPLAAEEILAWVGELGLTVPALPLQSALIQCCAERPQILVPYVEQAQGQVREALGRVLGEVATPSLGMDLLQFVGDSLDELRAAAARAMSHANPNLALDVLNQLVRDPIWFVRLRAVVSMGQLANPHTIPTLLRGLTDSHRLVRLRAAEALVGFRTELVSIFEQVVSSRDRYALHAYLTALENMNLRTTLEENLKTTNALNRAQKKHLREILQTGMFDPESLAVPIPTPSLVDSPS